MRNLYISKIEFVTVFYAMLAAVMALLWLVLRLRPPFRPFDRTNSLKVFNAARTFRIKSDEYIVYPWHQYGRGFALDASDIDEYFIWWSKNDKTYANIFSHCIAY